MDKDNKEKIYKISEAAEVLGVHPDTLRKWEKEGLVVPHKAGAHRRYTLEQIKDLKKIRIVNDSPRKRKENKDYSKYTRKQLEAELLLLKKQKKYGLVWEAKEEDIVETCKTQTPI